MEERNASLVSVVIPAYNASTFVAQAVESALIQTYPDLEVLVTDDGSSDDTPAVLASFGSSIKRLRQSNQGLAAARNAAVRAARGEFIAFLDADDRWHPKKIETQIAVLQQRPECAFVHSAVSFIDAEGARIDRPRKPWHDTRLEGFCTSDLLEHNTIIPSTVLVRRSVLDREPFRRGIHGCEDWELWLRLSLKWPIAYIDDQLADYRVHGSNMSSNSRLMLASSVGVMTALLACDDLPRSIRNEARHALRMRRVELGNYEYEFGDRVRARALFLQGIAALDAPSIMRLVVTLMPGDGRPFIRRFKAWLANRNGHATVSTAPDAQKRSAPTRLSSSR